MSGKGSEKLGDRTMEVGEEEISAMEVPSSIVGSLGHESNETLDTMMK